METDVKILRDFLQKNGDFAKFEPVIKGVFLANFILGKKGNVEEAKKALENYLQVRTQSYPEILISTLPITSRLYEINMCRFLSKPDQDGNLVSIIRASNWEVLPDLKETGEEWVRESGSIWDTVMHMRSTQCETGVVGVFDCRGNTFDHIRIMTPSLIRRTQRLLLAYPVRIKAAHVIIDSFLIKSLLSLVLPLVPKKISKRLKLHKNFDTVLEYIPSSILPIELGGEVEDESCYDLEFVQKMQGMEEYFLEFIRVLKADHSCM